MSDAAVSRSRPLSIPTAHRQAARAPGDSTVKLESKWRRLTRPLRTMGRVDFRGLEIDPAPAEIREDLDYGRN
ncbi:MAG: hypothetical protein JW722_08220 [Demequinaceae bacterium]|nr:hypothetical protein [Demequinaceae bacterium]